MVAFNTLLVAGTLAFGAGVLVTVVVGLLIATFLNTRKKQDEEYEGGLYTIPMSSLGQGGGGGGQSLNSLMALYQQAQAAKEAEKGATPKAETGGQYL